MRWATVILGVLLVAMAASGGWLLHGFVVKDACLDMGGSWEAKRHICTSADYLRDIETEADPHAPEDQRLEEWPVAYRDEVGSQGGWPVFMLVNETHSHTAAGSIRDDGGFYFSAVGPLRSCDFTPVCVDLALEDIPVPIVLLEGDGPQTFGRYTYEVGGVTGACETYTVRDQEGPAAAYENCWGRGITYIDLWVGAERRRELTLITPQGLTGTGLHSNERLRQRY